MRLACTLLGIVHHFSPRRLSRRMLEIVDCGLLQSRRCQTANRATVRQSSRAAASVASGSSETCERLASHELRDCHDPEG